MAAILIGEEEVDLDAVLEETREDVAEAVRHPVQRGVEVVDHLRPLPRVISLRALVTDTPTRVPRFGLGDAVEVPGSVLRFDGTFSRLEAVPARLRLAQERAEVVSYLGRLGLVEDLLVTSVTTPVTASSGAELSIRLEQLRVAEAFLAPLPEAAQPRGRRRRDKGRQPAREVSRASFLANLLGVGE